MLGAVLELLATATILRWTVMTEGDNISDKCQLYYATGGEMSVCTHFMASDFLLALSYPLLLQTLTCQLTNYHGDFLDCFLLQNGHSILLARRTVSLCVCLVVNTHTLSWHKQSMSVGQSIINSVNLSLWLSGFAE